MHFMPGQSVTFLTGHPKLQHASYISGCNIVDQLNFMREAVVPSKSMVTIPSSTANPTMGITYENKSRTNCLSVEKEKSLSRERGLKTIVENNNNNNNNNNNSCVNNINRITRNGSHDRCIINNVMRTNFLTDKGYRSLDKREKKREGCSIRSLCSEEKRLENFLSGSGDKHQPRESLLARFVRDQAATGHEPILEKDELIEIPKGGPVISIKDEKCSLLQPAVDVFSVPYSLKSSNISTSSPLIPPKNDVEHVVFKVKSEKKKKKLFEEVDEVLNEETKLLAESANVWKENFYKVDELNKKLLEEIQQKQNQLSEVSLNNQIVRKDNQTKDQLIEENKLIIMDLKEINNALKLSLETKEKDQNSLKEEIKKLKEVISKGQMENEEKSKGKYQELEKEIEKLKQANSLLVEQNKECKKTIEEKDTKITEMEMWANSIKRENIELESQSKENGNLVEVIKALNNNILEKQEDLRRKDDLIEKLMFELGLESCQIPDHLNLNEKVRDLEMALEDMVSKTENLIILNQNLNSDLEYQRLESERFIEIIQKLQGMQAMGRGRDERLLSSRRSKLEKENISAPPRPNDNPALLDTRGKLLDLSNSLNVNEVHRKEITMNKFEKTPGNSSSRQQWDYKEKRILSSKGTPFEEDVQNLLSKISPSGKTQLFYDYSNISISDGQNDSIDGDRDSSIFDTANKMDTSVV